MRKVININNDWKFIIGEEVYSEKIVDCKEWENISLPHTWNAFDGQDGGNDYFRGCGWYRKKIAYDEDFKQVYIRIGAASKKASIWCNGHYVGSHSGGFSSFCFEISNFLELGENYLAVLVDNSDSLNIYPKQADFTFFGGLYRDVELVCFDNVHFSMERYGSNGVFVTPSKDGKVKIVTHVSGGDKVVVDVLDAMNRKVAFSEGNITDKISEINFQMNDVQVWNGLKNPYLYEFQIKLISNNTTVDSITVKNGFREFVVDSEKGFILNNSEYPLYGVARHQDFQDKGWAITEKEQLIDFGLIREIGARTVRLAHYQHSEFFYDLCDREGIVVWAEVPFISEFDNRKESNDNIRQQLIELIVQNYNHPSICFWGLANELGIGGENQNLYQMLDELHQLAKSLDPTRLTTIANLSMTKPDSPILLNSELVAINEYFGWYEGNLDDHGTYFDRLHSELPTRPIAVSEYGAESVLSWHSENPKVKDYTEEYQALLHEKAWMSFSERKYMWGTWLWNMFDFAADARNEGGCKGRNNKGMVTYDRQVKKQAFYFYKACWSPEPFVYITGKRFTKRNESEINLKVYSNQRTLRLWVNGIHIDTLQDHTIFLFKNVKLKFGFNEILVKSETECTDSFIIELTDESLSEYVLTEDKHQMSEMVQQWFANTVPKHKEIIVREGYLSVKEIIDEIYLVSEGRQAIHEFIVEPLKVDNPEMAQRLENGGGLTFEGVWHHINKYLPEEAYYLLNERLIEIEKKQLEKKQIEKKQM